MGVGDDAALGRLPEDRLQPDHRHGLAGDDVEQHVAGAHRGELVDVAHEDQPGPRRDGPQQALHEGDVNHRRLVDDDQPGIEPPGFVPLEPAFLGAVFEEAVNGAGFAARGGFHAFGGAPGRRSEFHGHVFRVKDRENAVENGGFSGSGTAGDHEDLGADGRAHRLALLVRQPDRMGRFDPLDGFLGFDRHIFAGGGDEAFEQPGALRFGLPQTLKEKGLVFPHDESTRFERDEGIFEDLGPLLDAEKFARVPDKGVLSFEHVARVAGAVEQIQHARFDALRRVAGHAQLFGDLVGALERDAGNVLRQPVGVFAENGHGLVAVMFVDADGLADADAMALQKQHDRLNGPLFLPCRTQLRRAFPANARNRLQPFGLFADNAQGVDAERFDQPLREFGPDAGNQSRPEVLLDAADRVGQNGLVALHTQLPAEFRIIHPPAPEADGLTRRHRREVPDEGDELA